MREITSIILHHTATDAKYADNINVIRQWHMDKGWQDVGYHFHIGRKLAIGRPINNIGAHCRGRNTYSVGIALHGLEYFKESQFMELGKLLNMLFALFDLDKRNVHLHKDVGLTPTLCPSYTLEQAFQYL